MFVERAADELEARAPAAGRTLVLAKSLGTCAADWASRRGYPGIWLTPLLTEARVRGALSRQTAGGLLVGGTADPAWDGAAAHATGLDVVEVPGADHALHVGTDWRASLTALHTTLEAVERVAYETTAG